LHSRCGRVETPDYLFFDLDPFDVPFETVLSVALMCRVVCDQFGLRSYPKTSGATGMQIYVPIHPDHTYAQVRDLVGRAGHMMRKVDPGRLTMEWKVRKRGGHVFVDHNMNRQGANIASVYSVRPEAGAPVSTPLSWDEVQAGRVTPKDFTIVTIWDRLAGQSDDAIRIHDAVRLEHHGVLVSCAVPKGLTLTKGVRHLAVHPGDNPVADASFKGTIPKGHYGAGDVNIGDRGTYDLVEWTDKKVSFRLHGDRHHGEWHLIKTRGDDWLVLMASRSEEEPLASPPSNWTPMLAA